MRPALIGGIVALIVVVAFALGMFTQQETRGPAEELGATIDGAAEELSNSLE